MAGFEIERKAFGALVAALRRERGLTQKDLAGRLYVSDKAVSKWETGISLPDTALLIPLAEQLGVTVSELLLCRRETPDPMPPGQVEDLVRAAIGCGEPEKPLRAWQAPGPWRRRYVLALAAGAAGLWMLWGTGLWTILPIGWCLGAAFGAWACFWSPVRLPAFYDENRICFVSDGPLRLNMPGLYFNNRNWPHVVEVIRTWAFGSMALTPVLAAVLGRLLPPFWCEWLLLAALLAGLFLPLYRVGKKYE